MTLPGLPAYYHVDSQINSGGTAVVYRGVDRHSGKKVAIKKLFPNRIKDDFIINSFKEEANHYLYLSHPSIVKLENYIEDRDKGIFYLIMEYVDGTPLDVYLNTETNPMNDETLIPLFCRILDAIDYLHDERILHLDIKPGNIMILKNRQIKILDMGISAKLNDKEHNPKKCGTPAFMAPEQINQKELGYYTDIFALGVTLFNLITGKLPFQGINHTGIFEKICNESTPLITDFYSDANPGFQPIIERALQKKGNARYQTCKEFKEDLLKIKINEVQNNLEKLNDMKIITVGRDLNNTIVINDSFVGRNHLEMVFDDSGDKVKDLYTKNGTFVNGKRIPSGEEVYLSENDIVKIGNTPPLPWQEWKKNRGITITDTNPKLPKSKDPAKSKERWQKAGKFIGRYLWQIISMIIMMIIMSILMQYFRK